uniref:Uncharacterized protein n=1 Tax=Biomphalaria glabrata TaxID=6526 RepID=A0A2C9KIA8_BIOGL
MDLKSTWRTGLTQASSSCCFAACSLDVDLTGITRAFEAIKVRMSNKETSATTVMLVTDSLSNLIATIGGGRGGSPTIEEAVGAADNIFRFIGAVVSMFSQCGVRGNEAAYVLAREGGLTATNPYQSTTHQQKNQPTNQP